MLSAVKVKVRDPLLLNMFEVLISSLDEKFQRVSSLERGLQTVLSRLERMGAQLQLNRNTTAAILTRMDQLEQLLSRRPPPAGNASPQLTSVDGRLRRLQLAVTELQRTVANRTVPVARPVQIKRNLARARGRGPDVVPERLVKDAEKMSQVINELRGKVVAMDTKFGFHMSQVSENLSDIFRSVSTVSGVLLEAPRDNSTTARSKLDVLVDKIQPLMDVSSKMDEVWNVVVGTKSSIDDLVPKSDELIHTTSRQERAINDIHSDLQERTKQIIDNLGMVEQRLSEERPPSTGAGPAPDSGDPSSASKRYIRPVTFPTRPASLPTRPATSTAAAVGRLDAPFDLLDEQFLKAHENYTSVGDAPTTAVPRPENRGRPSGIVFPGRAPPSSDLNTSFIVTTEGNSSTNVGGYSCRDFLDRGVNESGIYYLHIHGTTFWYLKVFCDMETDGGGWTVIQRRDNYAEADQQSFNQAWEEYKQGFGSPTTAFWLGNENIFMLTNTEDYQLRIELEDFDNEKRYAQYNTFKMHGEDDNYKLEIGGYEGNAGDSMNDPWYGSNLNPFSTYDRDNDRSSLNCASMLKGGWWWRSCGRGLNGLYLADPNDVIARQGIVWYRWRGWDYSLKRSVMMIRPNRVRDKPAGDD
ncbi:uncharacterized protein LOC119100116 [Pollicipes pollicipes]|uniref:uncharacterized protein LOC119100116 n=1 Tax=Pollicipes pollicipes TaxID=41117 RepID=UPI001885511B|nr:uncharacterized protein LOC119100116 [Pollicipes pollicipes]